jgi:hypothetical protein
MVTREEKKINPSKQTANEVLYLFTNILLFDVEFHQFSLYNLDFLSNIIRKITY